MAKKELTKEEILNLACGVDNELFKMYVNNFDGDSNYLILASKALIENGNIDSTKIDENTRLKQLRLVVSLLENAKDIAIEKLPKADKYESLRLKNDIKIAYRYLISFYLDLKYLPQSYLTYKECMRDIKFGNNKKGYEYLQEGYSYNPETKIIYSIALYDGWFLKPNYEKAKNIIKELKEEDNYLCPEFSNKLALMAGEILIKEDNKKLASKLCNIAIKLDDNTAIAYYFNAYMDSKKKEEYLDKYVSLCIKEGIDILDPLEIMK